MREKILKFIIENIAVNKSNQDLSFETELFQSGIIDSFGLMELRDYIEDEFGLDIESYEIVDQEADTVQKISALILEMQDQ